MVQYKYHNKERNNCIKQAKNQDKVAIWQEAEALESSRDYIRELFYDENNDGKKLYTKEKKQKVIRKANSSWRSFECYRCKKD